MSVSEATSLPSTRETCGACMVGGTSTLVLLAAVFFFFMAVCFVLFLYIHAKWRLGPGASAEYEHLDDPTTQGLNPDVIMSLPTVVFEAKDYLKDGMECVVCLSEIVGGERARLLPKCGHGFHLECIDMWLFSHSTCPLCRNAVGAGLLENPEVPSTSSSLPTNILFWGTPSGSVQEAHSSSVPNPPPTCSSSEETLVVDIPRGAIEGFPSLEEESGNAKSASSSTGLRSLRRLLSRGKKVVGLVGCGGSSGGGGGGSAAEAVDVERGGGTGMSGVPTPKATPADP